MNNNLTKDQKVKLFDFVIEYANSIGSNFGHYNVNEDIKLFLKENEIQKGSLNVKRKSLYYIFFNNSKPSKYKKDKNISNDESYNILTHIRNSIAHGLIYRKSPRAKEVYLKDYNRNGNENMNAFIPIDLLFQFINLLKVSYR